MGERDTIKVFPFHQINNARLPSNRSTEMNLNLMQENMGLRQVVDNIRT